jgi:hypothetical protein
MYGPQNFSVKDIKSFSSDINNTHVSDAYVMAVISNISYNTMLLFYESTCDFNRFLNLQNVILSLSLHGLSPRANYTDRATAACRRSDCQLLRIEDATWSA